MNTATTTLQTVDAAQKIQNLRSNLVKVFLGDPSAADFMILSLIAGESILIEDVPGVGKTTLAKALAASLELKFQRVQCTPDLLPSDIFGFSIFNQSDGTFTFREGPIFCNVLLVDEINRASPRTQSALLEAMAEKQVTIEGKLHVLNQPFFVIATQNPIGFQGTFPLPESQLDRFLMKISLDYPDPEAEANMLFVHGKENVLNSIQPVLTLSEIRQIQLMAMDVKVEQSLADYLVAIVNQTRDHEAIKLGCSPRGSLMLMRTVQARALLKGRDYVLPDDIQDVAPYVLRHRMTLKKQSGSGLQQMDEGMEVIEKIVRDTPVPV